MVTLELYLVENASDARLKALLRILHATVISSTGNYIIDMLPQRASELFGTKIEEDPNNPGTYFSMPLRIPKVLEGIVANVHIKNKEIVDAEHLYG